MADEISPSLPKFDETHSSHVGELLEKLKPEIVRRWELRSRAEIPAAADKDSHTIQDELSKFIEQICRAFKETDLEARAAVACEVAIAHGQQRVGIAGYSLTQVIREYSLLRQVIIEVLSRERTPTSSERTVIDWFIDEAIANAADVFAEGEQAKLKLALAKAEQSNRELDHFALTAAHDLKSPLNSVSGFLSLIEDEIGGSATPDVREAMNWIQGAVRRMTTLIDGILEYSRLRPPEEEWKPFPCNDVVQAAVQNLKSVVTEKSGRVFHDDLPVIKGSFVLLTQLFQNLIANALKFHGASPPYVHVSAQEDGTFWRFTVEDNGIGFDPKYKEDIFGLYKKLHSGNAYQGSGIGLATCRRIVEIHGGKIWAESEPGKGTTIFFTLGKG